MYALILDIYGFRFNNTTSLLPKERHDITLPCSFASLRLRNINCGLLLRHRLILGERFPRRLFSGNCKKLVYPVKRRELSRMHRPKYPSSSLTVFFFMTCRLPRRRPPCTVTSSLSSAGWGGGGCSTGVGSRGSSSTSGISSSGAMSVGSFQVGVWGPGHTVSLVIIIVHHLLEPFLAFFPVFAVFCCCFGGAIWEQFFCLFFRCIIKHD